MAETPQTESELDRFLNQLSDALAQNGPDSPEVNHLLQTARSKHVEWFQVAQTAVELRRAYDQEGKPSGDRGQESPTRPPDRKRNAEPKSAARLLPLLMGSVLGACLLAILLSLVGQQPQDQRALAAEVSSAVGEEIKKQIPKAIEPAITELPKTVADNVRRQIQGEVNQAIEKSPQLKNLSGELAANLKGQVQQEVTNAISNSPVLTNLTDQLIKDVRKQVSSELAVLLPKTLDSKAVAEKVSSAVADKLALKFNDNYFEKLTARIATNLAPDVAKLVKQELHRELVGILKSYGQFPPIGSGITSIVFAPEGKRAVFIRRDGRGALWRSLEEKDRISFGGGFKVASCAFSKNGDQVLLGCFDGSIRFVEKVGGFSGENARPLEGHTGMVTSVVFSPDSPFAFSAGTDKTVRVWDLREFRQVHRIDLPSSTAAPVIFSADARYFLVAEETGMVALWDLRRGKLERELGKVDHLTTSLFSPDSRHVLTATAVGTVMLWETASGKRVSLEWPRQRISALAFSADGHRVLAGSYEGEVCVWDSDSSKPRGTFRVDRESVIGVAFLPQANHLITGSANGIIRIWDWHEPKEPKKVHELSAHMD